MDVANLSPRQKEVLRGFVLARVGRYGYSPLPHNGNTRRVWAALERRGIIEVRDYAHGGRNLYGLSDAYLALMRSVGIDT